MMHTDEQIKVLGRIEGYKNEIQGLDARLASLTLWKPAASLRKECHEVLQRIDDITFRVDRKLAVTIIGPGGAGKSTLFNAIAGKDDLSASGKRRPTTENIILLCKDPRDVDGIKDTLGVDNLEIKVEPENPLLNHILLIDTPDTDSTVQEAHVPLVRQAIKNSDVLLCVFNAENPKTRDHVDFFASFIPYFQGSALIGILNKCDRIDEKELTEAILPQFKRYIKDAWDQPLQSLFCISARRHLQHPGWDDKATPRHAFDQFGDLRQAFSHRFNHSEASTNRLESARHLRDFIADEIQSKAVGNAETLSDAKVSAARAEQSGLKDAFQALQEEGSGQGLGVNVLLYQRLANRWMGPVGWMIAIWARLLIFGTGLMTIFRFGNPIRQLMGVLSSLRHFKDAQANIQDAEKNERIGTAMRGYRVAIMKRWPDIAEKLIHGGFDNSVRQTAHMLPQEKEVDTTLSALWQEALGATLEKKARACSHFILQLIFNLPILALLAHIGWLTARHYFSGDYLTSDFFLHAFLTAAIVLLLSFFLFQGCLRVVAGPERILRNAFRRVQQDTEPFQNLSASQLFEQLEIILELSNNRNVS